MLATSRLSQDTASKKGRCSSTSTDNQPLGIVLWDCLKSAGWESLTNLPVPFENHEDAIDSTAAILRSRSYASKVPSVGAWLRQLLSREGPCDHVDRAHEAAPAKWKPLPLCKTKMERQIISYAKWFKLVESDLSRSRSWVFGRLP